jgi:hypothetical protein
MHPRSHSLHQRRSAQVQQRRGERTEANRSTSEQNALPFPLPSRATASPRPWLPLTAGNARGFSCHNFRCQMGPEPRPWRQIRRRDQPGPDANMADHDHQLVDRCEGEWIMVPGWLEQRSRPAGMKINKHDESQEAEALVPGRPSRTVIGSQDPYSDLAPADYLRFCRCGRRARAEYRSSCSVVFQRRRAAGSSDRRTGRSVLGPAPTSACPLV